MVDSTVSTTSKPADQVAESKSPQDTRGTDSRSMFAIVTSVLALLISIAGFSYTVFHDTKTDQQTRRTALREQIKFLINLDGNANYVNAVAKEAFNLATSFPADATSPEMIIIGNALSHVFDSGRAERIMQLAIDHSDDPADEARARRAWGSILMFQKRFDEADQQFNQAMKVNLNPRYKDKDDETLISTRNLWTLIQWANALIDAKKCGEAKDKIRDAETTLLPHVADEFRTFPLPDIEQAKKYLVSNGCN